MANIPSPIYKSTVDSTDRLYYKPQGSDAYTQISNPTELQNLAKQGLVEVNKPYLSYTPPSVTQTVGQPPVAGQVQTGQAPATQTETSPGVFSSSKLTNFYDNQINLLKPQFEAASKALADTTTALGSMKAPDFRASYDQAYSTKVAPIDQNISAASDKLNSLDANIRSLEDAVRNEIGGRASEASIQAEVARRAKPLLLERQGYVDQITAAQNQRSSALSSITQSLGFEQQGFENQSAMLKAQRDLAQNTIDSYNTLIEKGANATNQDRDNFRQIFNALLTQAPGAIKNLTNDEYAQLESGFVPKSVMDKIGTTINEQKLSESKITPSQILTRASQIQTTASANGVYISNDDAIRQAQNEFAALGGSAYQLGTSMQTGVYDQSQVVGTPPSNGTVSFRTNNPGNIKYGDFAKSMGAVDSGIKAADGGTFAYFPSVEAGTNAQIQLLKAPSYANLTVDQAMRRWSNNGYGAEIVSGAISSNKKMSDLTPSELSVLQRAMQKREGWSGPTAQTSTNAPLTSNASVLNRIRSGVTPAQTPTTPAIQANTEPFIPQATTTNSKFTPQYYSTSLGQKMLDNEMQAKAKFEGNQIVKDFSTIQDQALTLKAIMDSGVGGPQDLAIVYSFMKALDPTSVVRESEYDAAAKSGNIFQGAFAKFNGYLKENGGSLPANVRDSFLTIIDARLGAKTKQYNNYADQTRSIAERQGLNPDNVAIKFNFTTLGGPSSRSSTSLSNPLNLNIGSTSGAPASDPLKLF